MSTLFRIGDAVIWNPSNSVADLFKAQAEGAASAYHLPSGLGSIANDECYIDLPVFERFLIALVKEYNGTGHYIVRSLIAGVIGTSYVLVERAGGQLPMTEPRQTQAWTELHREYARSMPQ